MKIILIDNYDSFTFNLYHYLSSLKAKVDVVRNDEITDKQIVKKKYDKVVLCQFADNPGNFQIDTILQQQLLHKQEQNKIDTP